MPAELETQRLVLRQFRDDDLDAFATLQADPVVARHVGDGSTNDRATSWRLMAMFLGHWQLRGHGQYAVEEAATTTLVGRVGLWHPEGWPGLEIGWMVARDRWGRGYATEGARAVAAAAFRSASIERLISLIRPSNAASARVALKLGAARERTIRFDGHDTDVYVLRRASLDP
jgi:RimJ/RimL family protein N-acetyltransferase